MFRIPKADKPGGVHIGSGRSGNSDRGRGHSRGRGRGGSSSRSDSQRHSRGGGGDARGRGRRGDPTRLRFKAPGSYYLNNPRTYRQRDRYFHLDPTIQRNVNSLLTRLKTPSVDTPDSNDEDLDDIVDKYKHIQDSEFKQKFVDIVSGSIEINLSRALLEGSKLIRSSKIDKKLIDEQMTRKSLKKYKKMLDFRVNLPSYKMKQEIIDLIRDNQVVVISGETGCGKTTQVAQFILDDEIKRSKGSTTKIVCTQPRRISAISVAERVAAERAEPLGKSVGYQIRLEKIKCRDYGSMLFCTTGLLLQYMQNDPALQGFSHIILDEIHERSIESDLIITLLKQIIPKRPDLKVILMSATLNSETFSRYYEDCPNIHIPGFIHPVEEFYLEDILHVTGFKFPVDKVPEIKGNMKKYLAIKKKANAFEAFMEPFLTKIKAEGSYPLHVTNQLLNPNIEVLELDLMEKLLEWISESKGPGAILVFLPGMMDISNLEKKLKGSGKFPAEKFHIFPLHSQLPTVEQKLIFEPPVDGVRKIIIATSIAETSITIEDVVYVVDCGKTKLNRFDISQNLETLEPEWTSLANAKQRKGRAGRVQPGEVYRLYTKARESTFEEYPTPEILRAPLEGVILQMKILQLGKVEVFLKSVMNPPEAKAINRSLDLLRSLNALDSDENLTPLGYHLAKLPLDPRTGKMVLLASIFSCVEPVFGIAASLAFKDAFYSPLDLEEEAKKAKLDLGMGHYSDHIALAEALRQYEWALRSRKAGQFCYENFLSFNTLKLLREMKQQFARYLVDMKFLESEDPRDSQSNRNSHNLALIKAIVCAGLYPNVAIVKSPGDPHYGNPSSVELKTSDTECMYIHPRSINAKLEHLSSQYVTYFLKQKSNAIFLHDTTCVNEAALIFAAPQCSIKEQGQRCLIVLNEFLSFACKQSTARVVQRLHEELEKFLEHKITHPGGIEYQSDEDLVLGAVIEFVSEDDFKVGRYRRSWN